MVEKGKDKDIEIVDAATRADVAREHNLPIHALRIGETFLPAAASVSNAFQPVEAVMEEAVLD